MISLGPGTLRFSARFGGTDNASILGMNRPTKALTQWARFGRTDTETQDSFTLSRKGFQESASLVALSKCPSSKSVPTDLKYSHRNDASGSW